MGQATMVREATGRVRVLTALGVGAGSGLVWGVAARLWMRLIAEDPAFTWSGTLFIVGAATVVGLGMGLAAAARRNRWRPWLRRTATVLGGGSVILLGAGAGSLTLPTVVLGGVALARTTINLPVRLAALGLAGLLVVATGSASDVRLVAVIAVLGVVLITGYRARLVMTLLALAPVGLVVGTLLFEDGSLPLWQRLAGAALYGPLLAPLTLWFARTVAPFEHR